MELSEDQARDAYVAGLLHDLGRLVLIDNFQSIHETIRERAKSENKSLFELERETLKISQADVIGFLVALWGMRDRISAALTFQEHPWDAPNPDFMQTAAAVYIAHYKNHLSHPVSQFKQPDLNTDFIEANHWTPLLK
jgi:HD-like signal output (HDOD) protein